QAIRRHRVETVTGFVGRTRETQQAIAALEKGSNLLIRGRAGIGKSAFLRHLRTNTDDLSKPVIWISAGTAKHVLEALCRQLHESVGLAVSATHLGPRLLARAQRDGGLLWKDLARTIHRLGVSDTVEIVVAALRKRRCLIFIESLEVAPTLADLYAELIEHAQVAAAIDDKNRRVRIERLVWRFHETIELKPLPLDDCEYIAEQWLGEHPLRFSDEGTRRRFLRHVAQDSGGVPAAIRGMLESAAKEPEITPAIARGFTHEAGVRYLDMTPLVILLIVVFMGMRYISRGFGLQEMLVWSGVATALFTGVRFFMYQMNRR
ncbi:MAG: ATP-binding protein, partial [Sedimenticola sp.]